MSNPASHPVSTGPHVADALPLVAALLAQSDPRHDIEVEITATAGTRYVPRYRRFAPPSARVGYELQVPANHVDEYATALDPLVKADFWANERDGGRWAVVHDDQHAVLDALAGLPEVPVHVQVSEFPAAELRPALIPSESDPIRAGIEWSAWWPPVPELELGAQLKHAGVELFVNSKALWDLEPAEPGYRLYVVTGQREGEAARAAHLAKEAGLQTLGPGEPY